MLGVIQRLVPLLLIVGHEAQAQAPKPDPQACTAIVKAADRLECFDKAFPKRIVAAPAKAEPAPVDLKLLVTKERQCDLGTLYDALSKTITPKSDYETKEEFSARGFRQLAAAGVQSSGIFCRATNIPISYDADKGGYTVEGMFPTKSLYESLGEYDGTTSTGAKIKVQRTVFKAWSGDNQLAEHIVAKIPAAVAEKFGKNVAEGAILDVARPFYSQYQLEDEPTIAKPVAMKSIMYTLSFEQKYAFLYNTDTFEVLWSRPIIKCESSGYVYFMLEKCGVIGKPWVAK